MPSDSTYGRVIDLPKGKVSATQSPRSNPVPAAPSLTDLLCTKPADPSAMGFLLATLPHETRPILWVQDYTSRRENGYVHIPSLPNLGITQPILQVQVSQPRDVLWAMEEGAACAGLSAVIGEVHGAPAALSFTATKRLVMRAEASGVAVYLLRSGDPGVLSAARMRWRIAALPSEPHSDDPQAPGNPQWDVDLFRARVASPGHWTAQYDQRNTRTADRLNLVPRIDAGAVDSRDQPIPDRAEA